MNNALLREVYRDLVTGHFVSREYALKNPTTTTRRYVLNCPPPSALSKFYRQLQ